MNVDTPIVDEPIPRETIRDVDEGYLSTCNAMHCRWQGLFPNAEIALEAVENHYDHAERNGKYHHGMRKHVVVALIDSATAVVAEESEITGPDDRYEPDVRDQAAFPRTTGDVDALVNTGDMIQLPQEREGKVWRVSETRSLGLPTWTIEYVDPDRDGWPNPETEWQRGKDQSWLNEMIAVDGTPVKRYTGQEYPVVGRHADFQGRLDAFGGESA